MVAKWLEDDGDQPGGRKRDGEVALGIKQRSEPSHQQRVEPDNARTQRPVDEGAFDDDVDVEQPIAQDGVAHGERGTYQANDDYYVAEPNEPRSTAYMWRDHVQEYGAADSPH